MTISGPVMPSPKPSSISCTAFFWSPANRTIPSSSLVDGTASTPSSTTAANNTGIGWATTNLTHRSPLLGTESGSSPRRRPGMCNAKALRPNRPRTAGSSVTAANTATTIAKAAV